MPSASDTAYPRLKANPSQKDLDEIYSPTDYELVFASERTKHPAWRVGLLMLLKTFQRLGYFVSSTEIPHPIVQHISNCADFPGMTDQLEAYDKSTARDRHMVLIRDYAGVTAYGKDARQIIINTCMNAAKTRDDLPDIINMAIEELVRQCYELPAFSTLMRIARISRNKTNREYQSHVCGSLNDEDWHRLLTILKRPDKGSQSLWDQIKREPKRSTVPQLKDFMIHLKWLQTQEVAHKAFSEIPDAKVRQFAAEAKSLDLSSINDMPERKRMTLTAALITKQVARSLDDVAEMFIRQVRKMKYKAGEALKDYFSEHSEQTDALILRLHDIVAAYKSGETRDDRLAAIERLLENDADDILTQCAAHNALAGNNSLPFLLPFYGSRRSSLFMFIENVDLVSTTQDHSLTDALSFIIANKGARAEWINVSKNPGEISSNCLDLSFVTDRWWSLVTGDKHKDTPVLKINRRFLEMCVFSAVMLELKSGDLCIPGSDNYNDYRKELVSEEEYQQGIVIYGEQAGIPVDGPLFIEKLQSELSSAAKMADDGFPDNEFLQIENGEPTLKKLKRKPEPEGLRKFDELLSEHMPDSNIIDILSDSEHWLNWTRFFGPISGHDAKIDNPRERYLITAFCYGCSLGPSQTARSMKSIDRRQVSFINQRHVTEESLNQAITAVINAYKRIPLQRVWGTGKSAAADGMKWDTQANNLMSEYSVRYGGYGGIGYYIIADSYVALMSRFQTCGVYEGHYILDLINENKSEIKPDTIHADTHGQSLVIFALAYLLGIELMPRIRNWKKLDMCRPFKGQKYTHIDSLFSTNADFELIETMLPDMLRVVLSIKAGKIMPSTILRRFATYSRKNKLYFAFRELGRVVRTRFLLKYISSLDLRHIIQSATNKMEAFNKFMQWVDFGGEGLLTERTRDEQRKMIKYNHLVANLLSFHTLVLMTKALNKIEKEGHTIDMEALADFSPYRNNHINRFGNYDVNKNRIPEPLELLLQLPSMEFLGRME